MTFHVFTPLQFAVGLIGLLISSLVFMTRMGVRLTGQVVYFPKPDFPLWADTIARRLWISLGTLILLHGTAVIFYPNWFIEFWRDASLVTQLAWAVGPLIVPLLFFKTAFHKFFIGAAVIGLIMGWGMYSSKQDTAQKAKAEAVRASKVEEYGMPHYRYGVFIVTAPPDKWSETVWIPKGEMWKFDNGPNPIFVNDVETQEIFELLANSKKTFRYNVLALRFKSALPGQAVDVEMQVGQIMKTEKNEGDKDDFWDNPNKNQHKKYNQTNYSRDSNVAKRPERKRKTNTVTFHWGIGNK